MKPTIDVIYYYIIQTDNGTRLLEADTRRQEGKYPMIKVLQSCILKLLLYSVNTGRVIYKTDNMQSVILLSFIASSSLLPCGLQSTHPPMPYYISPYIVYNVYEVDILRQEEKYPMINIWQGCILKLLIIFSQFSAYPLQDRQYAICHTFIIHRLFLHTAM